MTTRTHPLGEPVAAADFLTVRAPKAPRTFGENLDHANVSSEYALALCHAVLDRLEDLQELHGKSGPERNDNTAGHVNVAVTLMSLQVTKLLKLRKAMSAMASAHEKNVVRS